MTLPLWLIAGVAVLAFIGVAVLDYRLQRAIRIIDENALRTEEVVNANALSLDLLRGDFEESLLVSLDLCRTIDLLGGQVRLVSAEVFKPVSVTPAGKTALTLTKKSRKSSSR